MFRFNKFSNVDPLLAKYMLEKTYESVEKKKNENKMQSLVKHTNKHLSPLGFVSFTVLFVATLFLKNNYK